MRVLSSETSTASIVELVIEHESVAEYAEVILAAESQLHIPLPSPAEVEASRGQVIAAATTRMVNEPLGLLTQGLNPSRFDSWMPGLRRKAYRYFPSTTDLVHEVLADAVNPERSEATDQLIHAMTEAANAFTDPLEVVKVLTSAYIDRLLVDPAFRLEITAWLVMPDSPSLRRDLGNLHESLIDRGAEGLQAVLSSYGLEVRPPLTWRTFATMLLAMVQGTVIKAEVSGDSYDPDVLAYAVMGLVMGLTYRPEADATADDTTVDGATMSDATMDDTYLDHVAA